MDFTRQPIIETVITPREGCKLVVRSSKGIGQEEYFVDALEVVSFGNCFFFRSLERPKCFIVPVSDYEVLEVREARMVLKHVVPERTSQKQPQLREQQAPRPPREPRQQEQPQEAAQSEGETEAAGEGRSEVRLDQKKRDRRRHQRRRRGRDERDETGRTPGQGEGEREEDESGEEKESSSSTNLGEGEPQQHVTSTILSTLLPPPPTLISETIARYKDNEMFKGAFFNKDEKNSEVTAGAVDEEGPDLDIFTSHPWDAEEPKKVHHDDVTEEVAVEVLEEVVEEERHEHQEEEEQLPADNREGISKNGNK